MTKSEKAAQQRGHVGNWQASGLSVRRMQGGRKYLAGRVIVGTFRS
jgi:hypothetical protein